MEVVEYDHQRLLAREQLEQPPDGAMRAVAFVRNGLVGAVAAGSRGRNDLRELVHQLDAPRPAEVELLRGDVRIQRVHPDAERQVAFELSCGAGEHQEAAILGVAPQRGEQVCLADARLALHHDTGRCFGRKDVEGLIELRELELAPDRWEREFDGHRSVTLKPWCDSRLGRSF